MSKLKFLSVEDNAIEREVSALYCNLINIDVEFCVDGHEALKTLINATEQYDAILLDIDLPGMSGLEVLAEIRKMPSPISQIPVFAVTAAALKGDRERILRAGCDGYLSKPYSYTDLKYFLDRNFTQRHIKAS
jgi:two-component system cell cycle response regulator DivK